MLCVVLVVIGSTAVRNREQHNHADARLLHRRNAAHQRGAVAALHEVGNQKEESLLRFLNQCLAVLDRVVDVGAAAELKAEEQLDRILDLIAQVDNLRRKGDHMGLHGAERGEDATHDRGVEHRLSHRAALVDVEDNVILCGVILLLRKEVVPLGENALFRRIVVFEPVAYGLFKIKSRRRGNRCVLCPLAGGHDRAAHIFRETALNLLDNALNKAARALPALLRHLIL